MIAFLANHKYYLVIESFLLTANFKKNSTWLKNFNLSLISSWFITSIDIYDNIIWIHLNKYCPLYFLYKFYVRLALFQTHQCNIRVNFSFPPGSIEKSFGQ